MSDLIERALRLARRLQERAHELQTPQERRQQAELDRMIQHPEDKVTLVKMTDQAFRARLPWRSVEQLQHILDVQGIPRFFSPLDRTLLRGFQSFGGYLPGVAVPLVKEKMQHETANVVLPAEEERLARHLEARRLEGVRMNVNVLGEALLGERDAERRLEGYLRLIAHPRIEVVSVKISTLYSQISPLAREHTVGVLCERMERLFRAAASTVFEAADGEARPKLVYMDMEEYRDLEITMEVFERTLDRPGLEGAHGGIVLQAYVPDSFAQQKRLTVWAKQRVGRGAEPVTLRIVKGANMEMERVEASLHGWPQAPFKTKVETDANYKRMLDFGCEPANAAAVGLGVASHNLFDLAYGLVLASERDVVDRIQVEMLEGMANHQRRALFETTRNLLLYAPACRQNEFVSAIGYLVRRLDENTGPDNFLRHAFRLRADSEEWKLLESAFRDAFAAVGTLPTAPRRRQDRSRAAVPAMEANRPWQAFVNEPDTDFSLIANVRWAEDVCARWRSRHGESALEIPLVVAGREIRPGPGRDGTESLDPSRPGTVVARVAFGTAGDVDEAVSCATEDPDGWRGKSARERGAFLKAAAQNLRERRGDLSGVALAEAGKILPESDPEVSEAIDFCEFYARSAEDLDALANVSVRGRGVVAVVPPWNFPIAIPCGGVAAALAAGNTVILKPAPATVATGYEVCRAFWDAGVSKTALQFLPGSDDVVGTALVTHRGVDAVVFTGGTATAEKLLSLRPSMCLVAETGGKNATIVTALSDRDLAIRHVVQSAFGHSGQKCSATSLLVLEDSVYDDSSFRDTLVDAVASLPVGSAWDPETRVGPLIRPPSGALSSALEEIEDGGEWALEPRFVDGNPQLVSPGIRWGVQPGSRLHTTELFGPVLGVMRARDLEEAIGLVNATGYGLTSGLQTLDEREQEQWIDSLRAGNLYVNRGTTGAIVLRQPFGGFGRSAFGPGLKAGGPNTLVPLLEARDVGRPAGAETISGEVSDLLGRLARRSDVDAGDLDRLRAAAASYTLHHEREIGVVHDHFRLVGQDNLRRYLPVRDLRIRVLPDDDFFEVFARAAAAKIVGCRSTVSAPDAELELVSRLAELTESWAGAIEFVEESAAEFAAVVAAAGTDRVRYADPTRVEEEVRVAAAGSGVHLASSRVLAEGRFELLAYVREQSLSIDYHRYGNLGSRADEDRSPVS